VVTSPKVPSAQRIWLGRERELGELESGLTELLAGRGGLFLVTGEPGIGKTRLADELGRTAAARGLAVHWGRAWEAGGAPVYWPFIQALRSVCRTLDDAALDAVLRSHGSELAELIPELRARHASPRADAPVAIDRFQLFEAVNALLHAAVAKAPQVIVLDDLHAADPSSLLLLHFIVRDLRSRPLLLLGTYREAEARLSAEVGPTLAKIAREACVLPLRRLERGEVADYVAQATGAVPSAERLEAIHRQSEGNPLFLRELTQLTTPTVRQPDGIREVLRARLSLLTSDVRRPLEAAAVLGREFELAHLGALVQASEADLGPAADAGIVEPLEPGVRWRFTHVLLRESLYEDLAPDRRTHLHRAVAAMLRRRAGDTSLAEVAHHLVHAIPEVGVDEAADAVLRAAERAMKLLAFEDASSLLARASKMLEDVEGEERRLFEVLLQLGIARIRAGDVNQGRETCLRAAALARRLGDGERLARAILGSTCEFVPGVRDLDVIALLEEALTALPPGDGSLRARCMAQLAAERQPEPDTGPLVDLAREAVAMARRVGDVDALRFTLSCAGLAMLVYGDPAERLLLNQESLRLALEAGDKLTALRAHLVLGADHTELGDRGASLAHLHAYRDLLKFRQARYRWMGLGLATQTAMYEGRLDEAEQLWAEAERLSRDDQSRGGELALMPVGLARARDRDFDLTGLESRVRAALGASQQGLGSCIGEMLIAQLYARAGDRKRTEAQLAAVRSHPVFAAIKEASWLALLAEPCHLTKDAALAERLYPILLPRARRFFWLGPMGAYFEPPYGRQLGLLAQTLGRFDDAVAHLEEAEARAAEVGMRSHLGRLRYELAGALLARGGAGDRERAATLLQQARALAEELGQTRLLALISTDAAPPPPNIPPNEPRLSMILEGETWAITWQGRTIRLRDSRGLRVLQQLLASPGQEFHVLQLISPGDEDGDRGDAGVVLDQQAVQAYRRRLLDLREELEEAEEFGDAGRTARARDEMAALTQELARAVGLGGRARRAGSAAERARTTVQKRLRNAIQRIEDNLPDLATHLDQTIRTGAFCGYLPRGRPRTRR
jgi:tetratricopeptide (TPR) repeat protein